MGLFSSPKIPGIDTAALSRIAEQDAAVQRDILGRKKLALQPLTQQFRTDRNTFSAGIEPAAENLITRYGQDLQGVSAQEKAANQNAVVAQRQQAFRDVPEIQRAIRESLGGNNLLRTGGAVGAIAAPITDAARASADFSTGLETERLGNEARRSEGLAGTSFKTRTQALNKRLGVDEQTLNSLAEMGRTDLLDEYASLAGIESQLGADKLSIEQARQANAQAQAAAAASRRGRILSTLGSLGGAAIGSLGGPLGVGIGSQLGGLVGNMAGGGGGGGSFDPTLLYALASRQPANKTAVVNSLGGRVPTGTGRY